MSRCIHAKLASDLESRMLSDSRFVLPTVSQHAREQGVSYCTVWKAFQILIRKGILVARPGRKTCVSPAFRTVPDTSQITLADRLCATLRKGVVDGVYPSGSRFPKIGYFVASEGVSHPVVSEAFASLAQEGLAHKERRAWFVGPGTAQKQPQSSRNWPTVFMRVDNTASWHVNLTEPYTNALMSPFMVQLTKHGHRLSMVAQGHDMPGEPVIPVGLDRTLAAAKSLGGNYRGCLLHSVHPTEGSLDEWIGSLYRFEKPVVYVDLADVGARLTRRALSTKEKYFRLHTNNRAAVTVALDRLGLDGHRRIGIHGHEFYSWGTHRTTLLQEIGRAMKPPIEVVLAGASESHWNFGTLAGTYDFVNSINKVLADRRTGEGVQSEVFRRALIEESPALVSLLRDRGITALVALNDQMASEYYHWCQLARIRVPEDLTIISFDNLPQSILLPVSTVDFGTDRLGHLAAHILIGDLPISADTNGFISGECILVDRGSIGPPSDCARLRRLLAL